MPKKPLIIFLFLLIAIFIINANEKKVININDNEVTVNQFAVNFSISDLTLYQSSTVDMKSIKTGGIVLSAVGGGVLGLFYFLGILVCAAGWAIADKSPSDYDMMYTAIGLSFLPVGGILAAPVLAYQSYFNDGDTIDSEGEGVVTASAATAVLFFLFQLAGLSMLISGISMIGYSAKSKISLLLDSSGSIIKNDIKVIVGAKMTL